MDAAEFTTGQIHPIECVKEGWALIKDEYWLMFGISIVGAMIGGVSMYVLIGAMVCGIFYCYLKKIDGGKVSFDDLWVGFKYFWPSLPVTILIVGPIVIWMVILFATIYVPIIMAAIAGNKADQNQMLSVFLGAMVVDIIVALVMVCLHTLLIFCFPLIVDRQMSSWESIKLSARAVMKNLGGIGGLVGVNFLLALAGEAAFFVGLYLVIPIITVTNVVAYRKVFPALGPRNLEPPPPNAYQGL